MHNYEVEIKVLLGDTQSKDTFMRKVEESFPEVCYQYSESQKNHYFEGGNLMNLLDTFRQYINKEEDILSLHTLIQDAKSFSVRTRGTEKQTILVVKATVNDESSSNGTSRIEWEVDLFPMSLEDMDQKVLEAGFTYQAKWSRERFVYLLSSLDAPIKNITLCVDRNAGYGYIAEFEKIIEDPSLVDLTRQQLCKMIESIGYTELDQARLARMFDFYNKNWREYYGTENVFIIE